MKLLFSVPTGYHLRELVLPLKRYIESDADIEAVCVVTPAADVHEQIFADFGSKFSFYKNPASAAEHAELLRRLSPDIAVTDTVGHDELDYPILKAAAELGIKTFTFIASWDNVWKIERLLQAKKPIHIADHLVVWNSIMKKHLHAIFPDLADERVTIIGAPRLDYFSHTESIPSRQDLYAYLGLTDTSKPLIHVSTTELYPMEYVVETIAQAMRSKSIPQSYIYASVHPGGDMRRHNALKQHDAVVRYSFGRRDVAPHPAFAYAPTEKDIYMLVALFKYTAALVNHSSTTALESIVAGVPVVNVRYGKPWDWLGWYRSMVYRDFKEHYQDFIADNATYIARNKRSLIAAIQEALQTPGAKARARQKTLERMITTTDGTASQKMLTRIKRSAKKSQ